MDIETQRYARDTLRLAKLEMTFTGTLRLEFEFHEGVIMQPKMLLSSRKLDMATLKKIDGAAKKSCVS